MHSPYSMHDEPGTPDEIGDTYVTCEGDTLASIAARAGISNADSLFVENMAVLEAAAQAAGYGSSQQGAIIVPGTVLRIPR